MSMLRLRSTEAPFAEVAVAGEAARVLALVEAVGLWEPAELVSHLDARVFREALEACSRAGLVTSAGLQFGAIAEKGPQDLARWIAELRRSIEESPVPEVELPKLDQLLGTERIAELTGMAASSLRRYLARTRTVPDPVAWRVHAVVRMVAGLAGSYNERGIRLWFDRPRSQLGDRAPSDVLRGEWRPEDEGPRRVLELAEAVAG